MRKKFYFKMFCVFTSLAILGFFIGQPFTAFLNMFMASLFLAKIINM